ncbi:MAG: META domain-containing protein [Myxococcota bacterium]
MNLFEPRSASLALGSFLGVALAVGVACAATPEGSLGDEEWVLVEISGDPVPGGEIVATLRYSAAEKKVSGSAGCNRYFGTAVEGPAGGELKLGPIGATRMMCAPPAMELEGRFLGVLETVVRWERFGAELVLTGSAGSLRFEARTGS